MVKVYPVDLKKNDVIYINGSEHTIIEITHDYDMEMAYILAIDEDDNKVQITLDYKVQCFIA